MQIMQGRRVWKKSIIKKKIAFSNKFNSHVRDYNLYLRKKLRIVLRWTKNVEVLAFLRDLNLNR